MKDTDRHWSVDFVEHLRTVHFALIAVSIAFLTLASSPTTKEIDTALEQLRAINEVVRGWSPDFLQNAASDQIAHFVSDGRESAELFQLTGTTLQRQGSKNLAPELLAQLKQGSFPANTITLTNWRGKPLTRRLDFGKPNWVITGPIREIADFKLFPNERFVLLPQPWNLALFKRAWDLLNSGNSIDVPTKVDVAAAVEGSMLDNTPEHGSVPFYFGQASQRLDPKDVLKATIGFCDSEEKKHQLCFVSSFVAEPRINLPVSAVDSQKFDAQAHLIARFQHYRPFPGTFESSFRELDHFTSRLQTLDFDTLDTILVSERGRTGESFEQFGIKFPAQGATRWGEFILAGILLYFWVHLLEASKKIGRGAPGLDVAWIGVYSSRPSRLVFLVSAFLLPVCAAVVLAVRGLAVGDYSHASLALYSVCVLGIGSLAVGGWRQSRCLGLVIPDLASSGGANLKAHKVEMEISQAGPNGEVLKTIPSNDAKD